MIRSSLVVCATLCLVTACAGQGYYSEPGYKVKTPGPPPHAPAHGYRHKHHQGVELVFDSGLGVYVVVGIPDLYYYQGLYYRPRGRHWELSDSLDRGWHKVSRKKLPPGLQSHHPREGKGQKQKV